MSIYITTLILNDPSYKKDEPDAFEIYRLVDVGLNILCGVMSLYISKDEIEAMFVQPGEYFKDSQNYIDITLLVSIIL